MADRKEPPFYNDDSMGTVHFKLPFYETMELFIETLTGTCFELRVSPFEAVISVKAKIQRLEGIPVAQQHLIWNNLELDDEYRLYDYSIAEGCTLKLVLAMRGGPINTRRVTVEDPIKDVSELMEGSREDGGGWEKSPPHNKQVTFLVYRDGDQLNFFRVVDRGDGTLTPLSESLSGGSVYNVYTEDDDVGDTSAAAHSLENITTMNKMKLLKAKMEDMNLNKKPKKCAKLKPRPPVSPHPCGGSLGPPPGTRHHHHHHHHHHRLFRALPLVNQSRHSSSSTQQLPPIRDHHEPAEPPSSSNHLSVSRRAPPPSFSSASSSCYMLQEEEPSCWEEACPPIARPPPKVSRLDVGGARLMRDCVYPQLPPLATRGQPEGPFDVAESRGEALALGLLEDPSSSSSVGLVEPLAAAQTPPGPPRYEDLLSGDPLNLDVCTMQAEEGGGGLLGPLVVAPGTEQHHQLLAPAPSLLSTCTLGTTTTADRRTDSLHVSPPSPLPSCASPCLASRGLHHHQHFDFSTSSSTVRPHVQAQQHPPPKLLSPGTITPRPPPFTSTPLPARLRCVKVDSPGKRSEVICNSEARGITKMANQACKEPLGTLSNAQFLASLSSARPTPRAAGGIGSREEGLRLGLALPTAGASGPGILGSGAPSSSSSIPTNMHLLQEDLITQMSPLHRGASTAYMASNGLGSAGGTSTSIRRLGTPTYHLPPVKAPMGGKKKSSKHCFLCGKKTGLATSYECRCGHNFCATHRYAETHDCTYDYKSAGRRFLQESNPIISTPKLPKI